MPVMTPSTVTGALPCQIAESHKLSPPPRPQSQFPRPFAVNSDGDTALHWAAFRGNRRILRKLIAAKADVDARDNFFG